MKRKSYAMLFALLTLASCASDPSEPMHPNDALRFTDISAGYFSTCALSLDGKAYCWGINSFGTIGDGTRIGRNRPTAVLSSLTFVDIDAGAGHTCALTGGGEAVCWGQNDEGQVGDNTFIVKDRPTKVAGGLIFKSVTAGHAHSCGVTTDGTGYCWGDDSKGQLGDEATGKQSHPVRVTLTSEPFVTVIAGYYQTCGLTTSGKAICWGDNTAGQFDTKSYVEISAGDRFGCGLISGAKTPNCWGANRNGEIAAPQTELKHVYASRGASTVGFAEAYGCGIKRDDHAVCWGGAIRGVRAAGPPSVLNDDFTWQQLALGASHICGLTRTGYAYCAGANSDGQLGIGSNTDSPTLQAVVGPTQ